MKYKVLLFDADETLFDFKKSESIALEQAISDFDIPYDPDHHLKIYEAINTAIWKEFEEGKITQNTLKVERFKRLSQELDIDFDPHRFSERYMYHLAEASFLLEDTLTLLEKLHGKFELVIVTNGLAYVQNRRIGKSSIAEYFSNIVISEEVGVAKPNPEIFEHTLKLIGQVDKSEVLMIGDSLTSDIKGGIDFGVDTCWYNPKRLDNTSQVKPTYEINDLMSLMKII
ncbi:MAG: noncanonical pyrimidine nucleotidase, YjjG family [Clostridia bacterium]|nr:noncanonical pyrimidine nucleotidase, YjjG family [Clostridia bacterium]